MTQLAIAPAPPHRSAAGARRGFVLQVDLTEVAEDDLDDLLRTVQNLADLAAEWFPRSRTRAAITSTDGSAAVPPGRAASFRDRLRAVPATPELVVDPAARTLRLGGRTIDVTATELALLVHLAGAADRVVGRPELLASVWGGRPVPDGSRTVDVHVRRLREKTEPDEVVVTSRGEGYRLSPRFDVTVLG
jgi:hypothetical protein